MSPTSPANTGPQIPQPPAGKKKVSAKSKSEWLAPAILTVKTITAAAECAPFPYIKGVSGTVLILLETVQLVKNNREDLKELCTGTTEIIMMLHDQILTHGNTAVKFKALCEELESHLAAVILAVQSLHDPSKGLRKRMIEFMGSSKITGEIAGYQKQIQGVYSKLKLLAAIDTNAKVSKMYDIMAAPSFVVAPPIQNINNCPLPSRMFQGRQTILTKMDQFFTLNSGKQPIYVLHGLGGAGKTQIARKFIQESSARFSDTFLVDASTLNTIDIGLKNIAVSKGVGDSAQDALTWLTSKHEDWLLFFDNADDPNIKLNDFLPQCNHGNIIITSRNPALKVYGGHSPVSDMEETDAIALLLQSAAKESSEENLQVGAKIVKELYCLPLAIAQAGAFILKSEDLDGYLSLYAENRARLLGEEEEPQQPHDQYAWTVYTTWQISFDRLSQPAVGFLQLCSFLHHTGISEDMFRHASKYSFPLWLPPKEELQEPLQFLSHFTRSTGEWDSLSFLKVTNEIKAYSLITFDVATKVFSIHPLVHAWSRSTLIDEGSFRLCSRSLLGMAITEIPDHDMILASLRLMPHVAVVIPFNANVGPDFRAAFWGIYLGASKLKEAQNLMEQTLEKYKLVFGEDHLASLEAMHRLAVTYRRLGEYKRSENLEVTVLERWTKLLGEDHPNTLRAMGNLSSTYSDLGDFANAKKLQVLVLGAQTKLLGENHPETLTAMGNLAASHSDLGNFEKAKELKVAVLEKRTILLGVNHPETLSAMGSLATTYFKLGDFGKAKQFQDTVLEKRIRLLDEDHPETLKAMANLAVTHSELGDFKKAEALEVTVLTKRTTLLGEDHPETLTAMGNLAATYSGLGNFEKARELKVAVLRKRSTLLGKDHPETLTAMGNLAATHSELGQFKEARGLELTVLEKRITLLGEDHPDTLFAMGNLATTHSELGDFVKAKELRLIVLEKQTTLRGEDHPETLKAMKNLAMSHSDLGDFEGAKKLEALVLERFTKLLGEDNPDTLRAMGNLAVTHSILGDFMKAKDLQVIVLEKRTKLLGTDHPDTLRTLGNLVVTYSNLGDFIKAQQLADTVLEKRTKLLGMDHPETLSAISSLATTYFKLGNFGKAKELQVTALEKLVQVQGDDDPQTLNTMFNLAVTCFSQGEFDRAVGLASVVVEKQRKVLGDQHLDTINTMQTLEVMHRVQNSKTAS